MAQSREATKIRRTLLPGQPGTKKFVTEYGDRLVCVRYRYDKARHCKLTTVEVIAEQRVWKAETRDPLPNALVLVRVAYEETELRKRVKTAGGKWNQRKGVWEMAYANVIALGLRDRIVEAAETASSNGKMATYSHAPD